MTTGDLKGALRKLEQGVRSLNYPQDIDYNGLAKGDPAAYLPIISYAFTSYSTCVTEQLLTSGVELTAKNDSRFLDAVYKLLRDQFHYKPLLLKDQFLHYGFAERKMQFSCDIINFVMKRHKELSSLHKVKALSNKNSNCPVRIQSRFKCASLIPDVLPPEPNVPITPLVERHLPNDDMKTIYISSSPENEFVEEKPVKEYTELPTSHESQALEIKSLKNQIAKCQEKLQELDVVQSRLQALECATAGKVIIDEKDWNNLLSRVVLLETQLLLHSRKNDTSSDSTSRNEDYTFCPKTSRNSSDKETRVETPESLSHQSSGYNSLLSADESPKAMSSNSLYLTEVTKTQTVKHKVERISKMIEETTELLKCPESSADTNVPGSFPSQKQSTADAGNLL
ncbi:centrosomal protein of 44 kDa isoform X2 [Stegostoma tigrinum]|uniref:centrosomal protein of 44 kDa isoform X2 n=1 Tax=Stegostoma tigrinum TaxID=3053191 RepID=UPI0028702135|nr:centrosomal protein of 44 kDa isoform X2 [Stegostoma tigrinum]